MTGAEWVFRVAIAATRPFWLGLIAIAGIVAVVIKLC
jgi:hypothetical protein